MVTTYNTLLINTLDTRDPIGSKKYKSVMCKKVACKRRVDVDIFLDRFSSAYP